MQYFSSQLLHSTPHKGEYRICRNKKGLAQISQLPLSALVPPNHFIHRETRFKLPFYSASLALWARSGATKPRLCVAIRPVDWLRDRAKKREREKEKKPARTMSRWAVANWSRWDHFIGRVSSSRVTHTGFFYFLPLTCTFYFSFAL